jgi:hypothetical protein
LSLPLSLRILGNLFDNKASPMSKRLINTGSYPPISNHPPYVQLISFLSYLTLRPIVIPLILLSTYRTTQPTRTILDKLLDLGLQHRLLQVEVVHRANPQDALPGEARADAVHERAARRAEVIGHGVADCADGLLLAEDSHVLAPAEVLQVRVLDGEIRGEHGRGDLVAVGAVADERFDEAGAVCGEC